MKRNSLGVYCTFLYAKKKLFVNFGGILYYRYFQGTELLKGLKTQLLGGGGLLYHPQNDLEESRNFDLKIVFGLFLSI